MSSFVEILIATFILTLCILGILAVENDAIARSYDAYLNSVASLRLVNISERLRTGSAKNEYSNWDKENAYFLPNTHSTISGANYYTITLYWQPRNNKEQKLVSYATP